MRSDTPLKYPKKSHRKTVRIPRPSQSLAEFFGIMLGDGGINNLWQANITMNSVEDAEYALYVQKLIENLFGILPPVRKRKGRNAVVISAASTTLVDFLVEKGLPRGNKLKNGVCIPDWVLEKCSYRVACVRGLMDTDGCLFIHSHRTGGKRYENIGLCFTSYSPKMLGQVAGVFEEFGIMPHIGSQGRSIYLYRADAVAKYLKVFSTSI
ncbi:MAG: LAGLIDADG family homing endonuclease [Patescibacteria group bacterium]|nr:LAGLIDADG family homing endonuclease [Patescibacteria group bacterium]